MCGITGILGAHQEHELLKLSDLLAQRGPDGHGQWTSSDGKVGLAHRRLSIIDLSEHAAQPMVSSDKRYTVVFNGEIYNFKQVAAKLLARGYQFNTNSDTAILTPLYDWLGPDMLKELNGIFAFVIYDNQTKKAFFARDEFGIKPFYYYKNDNRFVFASELKSLLGLADAPRSINHEALFSYMVYLWSPGQPTLVNGIQKLLPGHCGTVDLTTGALSIRKWYSIPLAPIQSGKPVYNHKKTHQDLAQLLQTAVSDQMIADVPVGAFLSGGLDSSAIVACAATMVKDRSSFNTFCIDMDSRDAKSDGFTSDLGYAQKVAKHLGVKLHEMFVSPDTLRDNLAQMIYFLDEPEADPAPIFVKLICERARSLGIKVMLAGTGGDDFFSGYRRHILMSTMDNYSGLPIASAIAMLKIARCLPLGGSLGRRVSKALDIIDAPPEQALLNSFHFSSPALLSQCLSGDLKAQYASRAKDYLEQTMQDSAGQCLLNRQLHMELLGFLPDHNLNYTDKMSMAAGVEVRVPLLDKRLYEFAHDLPPGSKVKKGEAKWLFKRSMEAYLPHDVIYRPKTGFGAPVRQWMKRDLLPQLKSVLLSQKARQRGLFDPKQVEQLINDNAAGRVDAGYFLLSLLSVEFWMLQFHDPASPTMLSSVA